jgi:OFA family oxalate/formate antiporter-like MFS transporter
LCLGTVYAWSYFQNPLVTEYHWTNAQVAWAFSLAICFLGLAAAGGGLLLPRLGPRTLAVAGGLLFGAGYLVAALALHIHSLPLLLVGYGVIGGTGLGLGYVTPVATAAKWFPDRKGLVTGMVVMGFGLGALLMSKVVAPALMRHFNGDLVSVFLAMGAFFGIVAAAFGACLSNPPGSFTVPGLPAPAATAPAQSGAGESLAGCVLSGRFMCMWAVFFCNILAGISIISFQSPLFQDLWRRIAPTLTGAELAAYGSTLIGVSSLFNGIGRFFWGGLSDRIGRTIAFRMMLATQVLAFALLAFTNNPWCFGALICYVLLCYGGGFGTMPSFVLDTFGAKMMASVYGVILTAWSAAGIVGPQIVAALKDRFTDRAGVYSFGVSIAFLTVGLLLSFALSNRQTPAPARPAQDTDAGAKRG